MNDRRLQFAVLIILVGTCAFIADVLSPVTPTPMAHPAARTFVFTLLSLLVLAFVVGSLSVSVQEVRPTANPLYAHFRSRKLLKLICTLLV